MSIIIDRVSHVYGGTRGTLHRVCERIQTLGGMPGRLCTAWLRQHTPVRALECVDLAVDDGEVLAIVGPSGCGKSTLLRVVSGLIAQRTGRVYIDGTCVDGLSPKERGVSLLAQHCTLFPHMSVARNIGFIPMLRGDKSGDVAARVRAAAQLLRIEDQLGKKPHQLSGGQRQRVALAADIVAAGQRHVLLDEPFASIDGPLKREILRELPGIFAHLHATVLFVTHDKEEAALLADRIAVMHAGRIEQVGTYAELVERPRTDFVAEFFGGVDARCRGSNTREVRHAT